MSATDSLTRLRALAGTLARRAPVVLTATVALLESVLEAADPALATERAPTAPVALTADQVLVTAHVRGVPALTGAAGDHLILLASLGLDLTALGSAPRSSRCTGEASSASPISTSSPRAPTSVSPRYSTKPWPWEIPAHLGTAGYMSPEHARREELDGRSELYAAGIVLWELLANQRLRIGLRGDVTATTVFHAIPPPSERRQGIPVDLEAVAMRLLAYYREERYVTAEFAARDLMQCRDVRRDG